MSSEIQKIDNLINREQYRMYQLQIFNWGTFSGLHDIPIAERGFLFVGRSGTGKSTILDAFSALLIPPKWVDFNAAAREAERSSRDRNFATYIRGAWAEQQDNDSGQIATQYLRPGTTWSALALSYRNGLGQTVVLVQIFWLRGNASRNADVRRHYLIFENPFDLREIQNFDLNIRTLKQSFPNAATFDEFSPYCERFCRLLGIESEKALRLLHKTQSAKNLGDLNTFLRDFMLDKPDTFEVAERLVNEFSELNAAHQAVVTAKEQVLTLEPAREEYQSLQHHRQEKNNLDTLRSGIDSYRETYRKTLLENHIKTLEIQLNGFTGEIQGHRNSLKNHASCLHDFEQQHGDLGGNSISQWTTEKTELENQLNEKLRKKNQASEACQELEWPLSDTPHGFSELVGKARQELENGTKLANTTRTEQFDLVRQKDSIEKEFASTIKEVQTLQRQPSNIPAEMIELRSRIATAIGLHETALPFVGELIEVRSNESPWQGVIERVLHGFALSLLVEDNHYSSLSNYINNTHLGKRLVYFRITRTDPQNIKPIPMNSLIHKLTLKENKYKTWLETELKQRFDYTCVESLQAFRNTDRAITREGQIRHSKTRHEKDDRRQVDDRINWVLGFDNREKLALYERKAQTLADSLSQLDKNIDMLSDKDRLRSKRERLCQTLANIHWQEIDVAPLVDRIATITRQLHEALDGNVALQKIGNRIIQQKELISDAENTLRDCEVKHQSTANQINKNKDKLTNIQQLSLSPLTHYQHQELTIRFVEAYPPTLENLDDLSRNIERKLGKEIEILDNELNRLDKSIESRFTDFKRKWPMDAGDMDTSLASAQDFFAKLHRLETDGLPAHEQRFNALLQNQSHQNLAALATHLNQARKAISERLALVNESLSQVSFNPGTSLYIDLSDKQLPEVREFKQQIQQVLSHAWANDRGHTEARFAILRELVAQLSSQETAHKRWRETVLDVRLHVEFIGRELDVNNQQIEVYRSGAGKSGGQRQKLATTCLAAALRYQLGGSDHNVPIYAPVILDEAFDKADNEFTALAMNIFANFGFQMIVATPLKSVMTLEPFIGGACFVDISERKHSGVLLIEYDTDHQRLKLSEGTYANTSVIP
jgi:uncharacterized protein YPO0396